MTAGLNATNIALGVTSGLQAQYAKTFIVKNDKFNYFFGKVTSGDAGNIRRSAQNLRDLTTMGVTTEGQLMNVFNNAAKSGTVSFPETRTT
jgi:hypothetical protein